jgi:hypothetical protein
MSALEQPNLASHANYARMLQDAAFWQPYLDAVQRRHDLPLGQATPGAGGTFPTFLVGGYVVKFFGQLFDGAECFEIEQCLHSRVLSRLGVAVPRYVADGHLAGIIDWGDALWGDPYYDLPALFFGTFGGSKPLLRTFLDAYGWAVAAEFAHRAMTMTLVHEFNPLGQAPPAFEDIRTLHQLATLLWQP